MELRNLGNSEIKVTALCLGTMTWGEQNTEADAHAQLDLAMEHGVNFVDTAEMYAVPPRQETYGLTETYIGTWLRKSAKRDRIVLASKVAGRSSRMTWVRDGKNQLDRKNITAALDGSLRRLQTDYIDLYQLHWPDRVTNYFGQLNYPYVDKDRGTPIAQTVAVMGELIAAGKIRAYGLSNETPWGVMQYVKEARAQGVPLPATIQNPFSLLNRSFEIGLAECTHNEGVGLLAYSPLAFGLLTGKYAGGQSPAGARLTLFGSHFKRYTNPEAAAAVEEYLTLAQKYGLSPAQLALSFVTTRPFVSSNIIGATSLEQLRENLGSTSIVITKEMQKEIDRIHTRHPNPAP